MQSNRSMEIDQPSPRTIRLILHPKASDDELVAEAVESLLQTGHKIEICLTKEPGEASFFASEAVASGRFDTIVAGGGDGTINEVLNGMFVAGTEPNCALGIVPLGTANDFAASFGIPLDDPQAALELIMTSTPVPIDVGRMNGRLFLNMVSGGYGAEVTAGTSEDMKKLLGKFAYVLTGIVSVTSLAAKPTRFRGPDFLWEGNVLGLAVGNGRLAGGGFKVTPDAKLNDRMLDVLIIPEIAWSEFFELIRDLMHEPTPSEREATLYRQLPWMEVEAPNGLQVNLDGEPMAAEHFRFDLLEAQLLCHLPPEVV